MDKREHIDNRNHVQNVLQLRLDDEVSFIVVKLEADPVDVRDFVVQLTIDDQDGVLVDAIHTYSLIA